MSEAISRRFLVIWICGVMLLLSLRSSRPSLLAWPYLGDITGLDEVLELDDGDTVGSRGHSGGVIGGDHVVGVDNELEGRHLLDPAHELADVDLVTDNGSDLAVLDGIDDGVHAEGGVDSGDDHGLSEASLGGSHPLTGSVLKDGDRARSGKLVKVSGLGSRNEASGPEGGTKLVGHAANLSVGLVNGLPKLR